MLLDSHADIASNQIFTGGGDAIETGENPIVQLVE
jgi:hypothetical protein